MRKLDYDLLFLYTNNCRESNTNLSAILNKSPQRIFYTLEKFNEEKIIQNYCVLIDYSLFDLLLFRVYFRGGHSSESRFNKIVESLNTNPYVTSIFEFEGGEYDFYIEIMARNPSRFNKELKNIIKEFSELNNYSVAINIVTHIFDRKLKFDSKKKNITKNYQLLKKKYDSNMIIGGDKNPMIFSENDMMLIHELSKNPIAKYTDLALKTNLNIKTVIEMMKRLQNTKVIRSYQGIINFQKVDLIKNRIILKLHNVDPEEEKKLIDFCNEKDEIVQINKTIGSWDIELDVETFTVKDFRNIYLYIREYFKEMIKEFNSYQFYRVHKKNYLPEQLFIESIKKI